MSTLDINTNGSWRIVVADLRPAAEDSVKQACVVITNAAAAARTRRKDSGAPSWRLRDAEGRVFGRCQHSATDEGTVTTGWRFT